MEWGLKLHDMMIYERVHPRQTTDTRYLHAFEHMFVFTTGEIAVANMIVDCPNVMASGIDKAVQYDMGRMQLACGTKLVFVHHTANV